MQTEKPARANDNVIWVCSHCFFSSERAASVNTLRIQLVRLVVGKFLLAIEDIAVREVQQRDAEMVANLAQHGWKLRVDFAAALLCGFGALERAVIARNKIGEVD